MSERAFSDMTVRKLFTYLRGSGVYMTVDEDTGEVKGRGCDGTRKHTDEWMRRTLADEAEAKSFRELLDETHGTCDCTAIANTERHLLHEGYIYHEKSGGECFDMVPSFTVFYSFCAEVQSALPDNADHGDYIKALRNEVDRLEKMGPVYSTDELPCPSEWDECPHQRMLYGVDKEAGGNYCGMVDLMSAKGLQEWIEEHSIPPYNQEAIDYNHDGVLLDSDEENEWYPCIHEYKRYEAVAAELGSWRTMVTAEGRARWQLHHTADCGEGLTEEEKREVARGNLQHTPKLQ